MTFDQLVPRRTHSNFVHMGDVVEKMGGAEAFRYLMPYDSKTVETVAQMFHQDPHMNQSNNFKYLHHAGFKYMRLSSDTWEGPLWRHIREYGINGMSARGSVKLLKTTALMLAVKDGYLNEYEIQDFICR